MSVQIDKIFDSFSQNSLFLNKFVLQNSFNPDLISHRDKQIEQIAGILAPALRGEKPSNLFVYGQTGTGKTLSTQFVRNEMLGRATKNSLSLKIEYLNCKLKKVSDTEYRILAELVKKLGGSVPATGLPTDQVYNKFIELIEREKKLLILVFDEIDQAVKKNSDSFLYNLTRLNSELSQTQISLIGISNDLNFLESLDPRVRSSLGEEEIVFPPYNAIQLREILEKRAELAFRKDIVDDGVIAKCAAYAAREHGDARRALDLLRIAGEIAERQGSQRITQEFVDIANEKMDKDKMINVVESAPKQFQIALLSIIMLTEQKVETIFTGDIYSVYQELCGKCKTEVLTQRRVSDLIGEMDMLGLINANVISKGRHGRTREIKLSIPDKIMDRIKAILNESLNI
ncbi:orc1/cdc6 family replication initiation protein [Candidatus Pacearchaeota archaeon]|nr:orc1/cdc6 family replication initiation protein [Candidatus Pacearchaeota archaeon]